MPKPRSQQVDLEVTRFYHCMSRCVRRSFLCGQDPDTGKNYDHRREWISERMTYLASVFAVDVCSYGLMSNHCHLVLALDPERAALWSEKEVETRYESVYPTAVQDAREMPARTWKRKLISWRKRLCNLSWYMRALNEAIARRANAEDQCTGHFWEGRFRSQALLDVGALLTCMAYVDLNPIRAGTATTLEDSMFTSVRERLLAAARPQPKTPRGLMPFRDQESANPVSPNQPSPDQASADKASRQAESLPVSFDEYLELLRWTASTVREEGPARIPAKVPRALQIGGLDLQGWVDTLRDFPRRFFTMVGHVHHIRVASERRGYKRCPGTKAARALYQAA